MLRNSVHRSLKGVTKNRTKRIGYFGPAGTFTEQALLTQSDLASCDLVAYRTVPDVLDAVESGEVDQGFVPIENSIEGTVNFTQDALVFDHTLLIQREIVLDIEHCLLARKGVAVADVVGVMSIPVATAQCHSYLRKQFPKLDVRAANSTAEAAQLVAANTTEKLAAIAPKMQPKSMALKLLPLTSPTTKAIRLASCLLLKIPSHQQLVTTKPRLSFFSVLMNQGVCFQFCKSLLRDELIYPFCFRDPQNVAASEIIVSSCTPTATFKTN